MEGVFKRNEKSFFEVLFQIKFNVKWRSKSIMQSPVQSFPKTLNFLYFSSFSMFWLSFFSVLIMKKMYWSLVSAPELKSLSARSYMLTYHDAAKINHKLHFFIIKSYLISWFNFLTFISLSNANDKTVIVCYNILIYVASALLTFSCRNNCFLLN